MAAAAAALVLVVASVLVSEASTEENNRKFLQKVRLNSTKKTSHFIKLQEEEKVCDFNLKSKKLF